MNFHRVDFGSDFQEQIYCLYTKSLTLTESWFKESVQNQTDNFLARIIFHCVFFRRWLPFTLPSNNEAESRGLNKNVWY